MCIELIPFFITAVELNRVSVVRSVVVLHYSRELFEDVDKMLVRVRVGIRCIVVLCKFILCRLLLL